MICPYCNIDMEPIDLHGKLFCAHCGMTITSRIPEIKHLGDQGYEEKKDEVLEVPIVDNGPNLADIEKGIVKVDMGEDALGKEVKKEELFEDAAIAGAINQSLGIETPPPPAELEQTTKEDFEEIVEKLNQNQNEPNENETIPTEDITPSVEEAEKPTDEPTASWPITEEEIPKKTFDESVKEIDTLGASGILLDILDEEEVTKARGADLDKLVTSESLIQEVIDHLPAPPLPPPPKPKQVPVKKVEPKVDAINRKVTAEIFEEIKSAKGNNNIVNDSTTMPIEEKPVQELTDTNIPIEGEKPFNLESALEEPDGIREEEKVLPVGEQTEKVGENLEFTKEPTTEPVLPEPTLTTEPKAEPELPVPSMSEETAVIDYFKEALPPDAPVVPLEEKTETNGSLHDVTAKTIDEPLAEDEPVAGNELVIPAPANFHPDEKKELPPEIIELLEEAKKEEEEKSAHPMAVDKNTVTKERIKSVFNRDNDE